MANATIIEKIAELDGTDLDKLDVRQANSWEGYDIYVTTYTGGALGSMLYYRIVDGVPEHIPFEDVMQMVKEGYEPFGNEG